MVAPSRVVMSTAPCCTKKLLCKKYALLKKTSSQEAHLFLYTNYERTTTVPLLTILLLLYGLYVLPTMLRYERALLLYHHCCMYAYRCRCIIPTKLCCMACTYCQQCCDTSALYCCTTTAVCMRTAVDASYPQNSRRHGLYVRPILQQ